jgi:hypothetical protein
MYGSICPLLAFHFAFTYQCSSRCHHSLEQLGLQTCAYIYINAHRYVSKQCLASQVLICRCSFITHNILLSFFSLSIFVIINLRRRRRKISNSVAYENYRMLQLMYHDATRRSDSIGTHTHTYIHIDKRDDGEIDSCDYIHLLN